MPDAVPLSARLAAALAPRQPLLAAPHESAVRLVNGFLQGQPDLLAEVYAAGEAPIVAADGRALSRAVRVAGKVEPVFVEQIADMPQAIADHARDGDVLLCMGAGTIGSVAGKVVELLANQQPGAQKESAV